MNILLLYPENNNIKKSFLERLSISLFKSKEENINLIDISINLPLVWEEKLLDLNVDKLNTQDIIWADYVIICAEKNQSKSTIEIIKKSKSEGKKLVLCGNAIQESDAEYKLIDHFVANAASFEVFSNDVADNTVHKTYQPVFTKKYDIPFQAYSLWGLVSNFSRALQSSNY